MNKAIGGLLLPAPALAAGNSSQLDLATTFGSLVFVIAFILLLAWLLKRMRLPSMNGRDGLKVVRQLPVGTKERIMVVQAGEEQFLIGVTAQSVNMLSRLEKPIQDLESEPVPFASQLSQLLKKDENK